MAFITFIRNFIFLLITLCLFSMVNNPRMKERPLEKISRISQIDYSLFKHDTVLQYTEYANGNIVKIDSITLVVFSNGQRKVLRSLYIKKDSLAEAFMIKGSKQYEHVDSLIDIYNSLRITYIGINSEGMVDILFKYRYFLEYRVFIFPSSTIEE